MCSSASSWCTSVERLPPPSSPLKEQFLEEKEKKEFMGEERETNKMQLI